MMDFGFGDVLSGISKVVGGIMGQNQADNNEQMQKDIYADQRAWQRELALSGIQMKAADARAAGISPLVALGAQTYNPSPISVGDIGRSSPLGDAIASSGQDLSRAFQATRSSQDKVDAFTKTTQELTIQKMGLENELLASQVRKANGAGLLPPMPVAGKQPQLVDGQSATNLVTVDGHPVKDEDIESKAEGYPSIRKQRILGIPLRANPYSSDAQDAENRYGEPGEWLQGIGNFGFDAYYTLKQVLNEMRRRRRAGTAFGDLRNSAEEYFERR